MLSSLRTRIRLNKFKEFNKFNEFNEFNEFNPKYISTSKISSDICSSVLIPEIYKYDFQNKFNKDISIYNYFNTESSEDIYIYTLFIKYNKDINIYKLFSNIVLNKKLFYEIIQYSINNNLLIIENSKIFINNYIIDSNDNLFYDILNIIVKNELTNIGDYNKIILDIYNKSKIIMC